MKGAVSIPSFSITVTGLSQSIGEVLVERCLYFGGITNSQGYFSKEPFSSVPYEQIPALAQFELPLIDMCASITLLSLY